MLEGFKRFLKVFGKNLQVANIDMTNATIPTPAPIFAAKPRKIEAVILSEFYNNGMPAWTREAFESGAVVRSSLGRWTITTLEGPMKANDGDYLVRGVKKELYSVKPDIFKLTYETKMNS